MGEVQSVCGLDASVDLRADVVSVELFANLVKAHYLRDHIVKKICYQEAVEDVKNGVQYSELSSAVAGL